MVAAYGAYPGESDARVARGCLNDRAALAEGSGLLRGVHNGNADAVFDRVSGVVELQLGQNGCLSISGKPVNLDKRCPTNKLSGILINLGH